MAPDSREYQETPAPIPHNPKSLAQENPNQQAQRVASESYERGKEAKGNFNTLIQSSLADPKINAILQQYGITDGENLVRTTLQNFKGGINLFGQPNSPRDLVGINLTQSLLKEIDKKPGTLRDLIKSNVIFDYPDELIDYIIQLAKGEIDRNERSGDKAKEKLSKLLQEKYKRSFASYVIGPERELLSSDDSILNINEQANPDKTILINFSRSTPKAKEMLQSIAKIHGLDEFARALLDRGFNPQEPILYLTSAMDQDGTMFFRQGSKEFKVPSNMQNAHDFLRDFTDGRY